MKSKIKKIAVFTSIRSEYGLLKGLIAKLNEDPEFDFSLLVGGAHLSQRLGYTIDEIIEDGFPITSQFPFLLEDNIVASLSLLTEQIGNWFSTHELDLIIVLGDRFELLPVVNLALILNIPIAHISGGEVTEGAIDNQVRNAISKIAHIHFPATERYKENLIRMGEEPWRICVSGEPGLDEIKNLELIEKRKLFEDLGLDLNTKTMLATFHPETIDNTITPIFLETLLKAILDKHSDFQVLVTASNFDNGGVALNDLLVRLSAIQRRIVFIHSLGKLRYYSMLNVSEVLIGNSSSGLVEAKSFNIPVINIGNRQEGRLANKNVINASSNVQEILCKLDFALSKEFLSTFVSEDNIYSKGESTQTIIDFLKLIDPDLLLKKRNIL